MNNVLGVIKHVHNFQISCLGEMVQSDERTFFRDWTQQDFFYVVFNMLQQGLLTDSNFVQKCQSFNL